MIVKGLAYYNEFDPKAAAWLRELIKAGLIAPGDVDERSIKDVKADDLTSYTQKHFFAGIGGWSYALRLAGWTDDVAVWTGSCPCQPYSSAGKQKGNADDRNLWPDFYRLIAECRPNVVFGEQVESAIRHGWLDGVCADLEREGYAVGHAVLGAHSVGAPHIRQRLWWVGDASGERCGEAGHSKRPQAGAANVPAGSSSIDKLADAGSVEQRRLSSLGREEVAETRGDGTPSRMADSEHAERGTEHEKHGSASRGNRPGWGGGSSVACRDGKTRRIEPGITPLVDGLPGRVGLLRGYGNAIVPQVAAAFIEAYLEATTTHHTTTEPT